MAYSKTKWKYNGDRVPCCKTFVTGNMSDKYLPTWTMLHVSFIHFYQHYQFHGNSKLNENNM